MNNRITKSTLLWGGAALVLFAYVADASPLSYGRFLFDPSKSGIVKEYGNAGGNDPAAPIPFDHPVRDETKDIDARTIKFDYDTYSRKPDGTVSGGGALSGGFFFSDNIRVKDGFELHWAQTITADVTGENDRNRPPLACAGDSSGARRPPGGLGLRSSHRAPLAEGQRTPLIRLVSCD